MQRISFRQILHYGSASVSQTFPVTIAIVPLLSVCERHVNKVIKGDSKPESVELAIGAETHHAQRRDMQNCAHCFHHRTRMFTLAHEVAYTSDGVA